MTAGGLPQPSPGEAEAGGAAHAALRTRIAELRHGRRLTLRELSGALAADGHNLSVSTLSKIMTGGRRIDVDDVAALARVFGREPGDLFHPGRPGRLADELAETRAGRAAALGRAARAEAALDALTRAWARAEPHGAAAPAGVDQTWPG